MNCLYHVQHRQRDCKLQSLVRILRHDLSVMAVNDLLHDRQSQARSLAVLSFRAVKAFKQMRQVLRCRAAAVVLQRAVEKAFRPFHEDMDFPVLSGMFAGILDQVPESLGKPFLIAADDSFPFYGQGCVRPQGMHLFPVFFDHLPDIAFLKGKFISIGAQFFQPQEAADQRLHTLDLGDLLPGAYRDAPA